MFVVLIQVTKRDYAEESEWKQWTWRSEGDLFLRGAFFVQSGDPNWSKKHPETSDALPAGPATQVYELTKFAGALKCMVGKPC